MERLTKRNAWGEVVVSGKGEGDLQRKFMAIAERLAELEDAIESGKFIELPCIVSTLSPKYVVIVFRGKDGKLYKTHSFDTKEAEIKLNELKEWVQ